MGDLNDRLLTEVGVETFYRTFLGDLQPQGGHLKARCPFHDDTDPSLDVWDLARGLWICRAGCGDGDMVSFFCKARDLPTDGKGFRKTAEAIEKEFFNGHAPRPAPPPPPPKETQSPEEKLAEWEKHATLFLDGWPFVKDYPAEYGVHLYEKGTPQEAFLLPVYHAPSGRIVGVKYRYLKEQPPRGHRKKPYKSENMHPWCRPCNGIATRFCFKLHPEDIIRFPGGVIGHVALLAHPDSPVLLCEGEKDMLASARRIDLTQAVPVSFSAGAGSVPEGAVDLLRGRQNLICYDGDRSGVIGSKKVARALIDNGGNARILDLRLHPTHPVKGTKESKDLFDYFQGGGTATALLEWAKGVRPIEVEPPPKEPPPPDDGGPPGDGAAAGGDEDDDRPRVEHTVDIHETVDATERVLTERATRIGLYHRLGQLVHIVHEERDEETQKRQSPEVGIREVGSPLIRHFSAQAFRLLLSRHIRFTRYVEKDAGLKRTPPPMEVAQMMLEKGEWTMPRLEGFATAPFLRPNGSVCATPGYDWATSIIYEPDQEFDPIPENPTKDDALRALSLLSKPFEHFPFVVPDQHLAATFASMLALVARAAIRGPCPMVTVSAPTPGSGKTLLVWLAVSIVTGKKPASTDWVRDDDEFRKTVISMGLAGDRAVLIDNVEGKVGSGLLSSILTSDTFRGRLLGVNEMVDTRLQMVWFATGNNLETRADAFRRIVSIILDPKMEHPERRIFRGEHANVMAYARRLRSSLIPALLTVLRAYHLAGHPAPANHAPLGSFESWDDWVRRPLLWAMGVDPRPATGDDLDDGSAENEIIQGLLNAWHDAYPDESFHTVRSVIEMAKHPSSQGLMDALCSVNYRGEDRPIPKNISGALRRAKGRIINGLLAEKGMTDRTGTALWRVIRVG